MAATLIFPFYDVLVVYLLIKITWATTYYAHIEIMSSDGLLKLGLAAAAGAAVSWYLCGGTGSAATASPVAATAGVPAQQQPTGTKVVIVTGGSRGIGAAVSVLLGRQGYSVVVNYNSNKSKADAVVAEIIAAGGTAIAIAANVADEAAVVYVQT